MPYSSVSEDMATLIILGWERYLFNMVDEVLFVSNGDGDIFEVIKCWEEEAAVWGGGGVGVLPK